MFMPPVFPAHWHVSQPVLIADTFSSLVWKVSLPDGTPAIVKGLKPIEDIADELRGADYLVWRNGRGAVRLLGRENNLMLLEYAGERMLSHIVAEHGDYQATEIAAELMAKLYAASEEPLPSALLPIRDRFAALFQRARDDQNAGCQTDYVHAAIIADQMMSNASELRGLHGDLHHENIMFSSRGWLVIDPVGLVGEVGFGAANMFYDPADRDDLCLDPRRIAQMADAFSRALDVDPRRLLDQAYAYGCLSAAWNADGEEEQRDLAGATDVILDIKRLLLSPGNTSILPENIVGQSLSVGFRPLPQTTPFWRSHPLFSPELLQGIAYLRMTRLLRHNWSQT
ncbi:APH(6)-I family aminoglycoside O-phosphotransferase, partial [Escherichia coli]|nr:APH(6)-I family aminoglycoside O-phosphotransferase [Escherichia coli]